VKPYTKVKHYTHWGEPQQAAQSDGLEFLTPRCAKYGITPKQFVEMMRAQNCACKVCGYIPASPLDLTIDHDHDTGAVRGLLCSPCNTALGMFRDDPARMRAAAEYIEAAGSAPKPKPLKPVATRKTKADRIAEVQDLPSRCTNEQCADPIADGLVSCDPCAAYHARRGAYPGARTIAARRRQRWHRYQAAH